MPVPNWNQELRVELVFGGRTRGAVVKFTMFKLKDGV
jgi:hypothetical protein